VKDDDRVVLSPADGKINRNEDGQILISESVIVHVLNNRFGTNFATLDEAAKHFDSHPPQRRSSHRPKKAKP
jgi:hypothetical protein